MPRKRPLPGEPAGRGRGNSKKEAEQHAARQALLHEGFTLPAIAE